MYNNIYSDNIPDINESNN